MSTQPVGSAHNAELRVLPNPGNDTRAASATGRVKHDEKITVYVSGDELHALELARLSLARHHGIRMDRGRLVREAIATLVADLEARGSRSAIVHRMRGY